MSQTVSLCLTNTGNTTLSSTINIYSDYNTGWTLIDSNVPLSSITGSQCPYILIAPDGTNNIRLLDNGSNCFLDINLQTNSMCDLCDFGLSGVSTSNIGTISAGPLTGTCQANIGDYVINWYGPDSPTNLAFSSGSGTSFTYGYVHPLTNVIAIGGTYLPVLEKVKLSGITFSLTGGTGEVLTDLDCLSSVVVQDFRCDNGTTPGDYSHGITFTSQANGQPAQGLTGRFIISGTTDYFAFKFKGYNVYDTLKITFSGSSYPAPIVLENINVGTNAPINNTNAASIPRGLQTNDYFKKVMCLTGLTKNTGDYLLLEVTPNPSNPQTNWDLYFTCLSSTFDCSRCLDGYLNNPFKIVGSSITGITGTCNTINVNFNVSGCTSTQIFSEPTFKYMSLYYYNLFGSSGSPIIPNNSGVMYHSNISCNFTNLNYISPGYECTSNGTGFIKMTSTNDFVNPFTVNLEFSDISDFNAYYNSYLSMLPYSGSTNNNTIDYYRYSVMYYWYNTPSTTCSDSVNQNAIYFHLATAQVTTGTTMTGYTMNIVQPRLTGQTLFNSCDLNCNSNISNIVSYVNTFAPNIVTQTNVGLRATAPFYVTTALYSGSSAQLTWNFQSYNYWYAYSNLIYPYSGSSTLIPSLNTVTCNSINNISGSYYKIQYPYLYTVKLTNPSDVRDFDISANTISNGSVIGPYVLAYRYSGGSVTYSDSTYII